jgi:hypothetical protein
VPPCLNCTQDRQWTIQATSAVKGEVIRIVTLLTATMTIMTMIHAAIASTMTMMQGLGEGMDWLANVLASQQ